MDKPVGKIEGKKWKVNDNNTNCTRMDLNYLTIYYLIESTSKKKIIIPNP